MDDALSAISNLFVANDSVSQAALQLNNINAHDSKSQEDSLSVIENGYTAHANSQDNHSDATKRNMAHKSISQSSTVNDNDNSVTTSNSKRGTGNKKQRNDFNIANEIESSINDNILISMGSKRNINTSTHSTDRITNANRNSYQNQQIQTNYATNDSNRSRSLKSHRMDYNTISRKTITFDSLSSIENDPNNSVVRSHRSHNNANNNTNTKNTETKSPTKQIIKKSNKFRRFNY